MKVTWLTQAGLLLENSRIKIVADPYLTDSLGKLKPEKARRIPADESFFDASADVILLTHAHIDHTDTATLRRMLDGCKAPCLVLASPSAYEIVSELGGEHNYVLMAPHSVWSERGITFYAVNAEHSDRGAVGFIIDDGEVTYYISGDTVYNFEVIDDVLDAVGDEAELGKSLRSDAERNKTTFMTYYSPDEARTYAAQLTADAVSAIADFEGSAVLTDLAAYLLDRTN